jgi:hypothetical protein
MQEVIFYNKDTEKERKKTKIYQTSIQSSADLGPGLLQKDRPLRPAPLALISPPPLQKSWLN